VAKGWAAAGATAFTNGGRAGRAALAPRAARRAARVPPPDRASAPAGRERPLRPRSRPDPAGARGPITRDPALPQARRRRGRQGWGGGSGGRAGTAGASGAGGQAAPGRRRGSSKCAGVLFTGRPGAATLLPSGRARLGSRWRASCQTQAGAARQLACARQRMHVLVQFQEDLLAGRRWPGLGVRHGGRGEYTNWGLSLSAGHSTGAGLGGARRGRLAVCAGDRAARGRRRVAEHSPDGLRRTRRAARGR
jgi:hypothetical protein